MQSKKQEVILAEMQKSVQPDNLERPRPLVGILVLAVLAAVGFGGYKMYEAAQEKRLAQERQQQEERAAREFVIAREQARIAAEKAKALQDADKDTLRKLVSSCQSQVIELVSNSPFGVNFPHYSPTDLDKFADLGAAFGQKLGWPSVALDNYDFDAVGWNVEQISREKYPSRHISFVVEGAEDGLSVRQFAAVYSCDLDGLAIEKPEQTMKHYLD